MSVPPTLCIDCEYDLRGLPHDGRCPECGAEIARSRQRHEALLASGQPPLWMSSPAWLRKLGVGCALVLSSGIVVAAMRLHGIHPVPSRYLVYVLMPLWLSSAAALAVGLWLLATREPATQPRPIACALLRAGAVFEALRAVRGFVWSPPTFDGHWYILIVSGVVAAAVTAAIWARLRGLAKRSATPGLARWAWTLCWLLPAVIVVQVVFFSLLPMGKAGAWMVAPHPVLGEPSALTGLPFELLRDASIGWRILFWIPALLTTLAAMVTLTRMMLIFFNAAAIASAGERSVEKAEPVSAHDPGDVAVDKARRG